MNDAIRHNCPVDEIAAYIDGELAASREMELDLHFAGCSSCNQELNQQKQFLQSLELSLKEEAVELPPDFAKIVVANAESNVSGLRRPRERYNAIFISAALGLFVLFALGAQAGVLVDQVTAVGSFFGHLIYSFFIGLTIIARNLASQFEFGPSAIILLSVGFAVFSLYFSRKVLRTPGV